MNWQSEESSVEQDVVVVGAGLCGLSVAHLLKNQNLRVRVLESRAEPGGRIRSVRDSHTRETLGDLGPVWVWPEYQPLLQHWLETLGVSTVMQFGGEQSLIESSTESAARLHTMPAQPGSLRIDAGTTRLVEVLCERIGQSGISFGDHVTGIESSGDGVLVHSNARSAPLSARQVVLAMPPRIIQRSIRFTPELGDDIVEVLQNAPTWMASHARVVLLYAHAFWREQPHRGRVFSNIGPIGELQDHSGPTGFPAALTGFFAWPHQLRHNLEEEIKPAKEAQLVRLFGNDVPLPLQIVIKDWAQDSLVATPEDLNKAPGQRSLLSSRAREAQLQGKVWLAGSELAPNSPGLLEGAFSSAEYTAKCVLDSLAVS